MWIFAFFVRKYYNSDQPIIDRPIFLYDDKRNSSQEAD